MSRVRVGSLRIGVGIGFAMLLAMPLPAAAAGSDPNASQAVVGEPGAPATTSWIVTLKPGVDSRANAPATFAKAAGGRAGPDLQPRASRLRLPAARPRPRRALRRNPNVRTIVAESTRSTVARRADPDRRRADPGRPPDPATVPTSAGFTGKGVKVAILDTGHRPDPSRPRPEPRRRARPELHDDRAAAGRPRPRHPCRGHRRGGRERHRRHRRRAGGHARADQGPRRHRSTASGRTSSARSTT